MLRNLESFSQFQKYIKGLSLLLGSEIDYFLMHIDQPSHKLYYRIVSKDYHWDTVVTVETVSQYPVVIFEVENCVIR